MKPEWHSRCLVITVKKKERNQSSNHVWKQNKGVYLSRMDCDIKAASKQSDV